MPHDKNGRALSAGDMVIFTALLLSVSAGVENDCNISARLNGPEDEYRPEIACNSKLCELPVEFAEFKAPPFEPGEIEGIARVCHEANRAYCLMLGDTSQAHWDDAPEWQRNSAVKGVEFNLANPFAPASASHDSWMEVKRAEGWKYGAVKDADKKEHPCFVPYQELPPSQRLKDSIFKNIVAAFGGFPLVAEKMIEGRVFEDAAPTSLVLKGVIRRLEKDCEATRSLLADEAIGEQDAHDLRVEMDGMEAALSILRSQTEDSVSDRIGGVSETAPGEYPWVAESKGWRGELAQLAARLQANIEGVQEVDRPWLMFHAREELRNWIGRIEGSKERQSMERNAAVGRLQRALLDFPTVTPVALHGHGGMASAWMKVREAALWLQEDERLSMAEIETEPAEPAPTGHDLDGGVGSVALAGECGDGVGTVAAPGGPEGNPAERASGDGAKSETPREPAAAPVLP